MFHVYPLGFKKPVSIRRFEFVDGKIPPFVTHPSTAELAEQLITDPEALSNENYPGIYDSDGDYIPQYCDDPERIPQAMIANTPTGVKPAESSENVGGQDKPSSQPDNPSSSGDNK